MNHACISFCDNSDKYGRRICMALVIKAVVMVMLWHAFLPSIFITNYVKHTVTGFFLCLVTTYCINI